jgi:Flp pilus assembly protein TadD
LRELERAAREGPGEPRLILGWALALDAVGERRSAIQALAESVDGDGASGEVRQALVTLLRDAGDTEKALTRAREWSRAEPTETRARALVEALERPGSQRQP